MAVLYQGNVRLGVLVMLVLIFALIIAACSVCARDVMRRKKHEKNWKEGAGKKQFNFSSTVFFYKN